MQFLEFVTRRLMGKPSYGKTWPCPWCDADKPSMTLNPPKDGCDTKLRCFNCGKIADAYDLAQYFRSDAPWPGPRIALVRSWERDFARIAASEVAAAKASKGPCKSPSALIPKGESDGDVAANEMAIAWVVKDAIATFAQWGLTEEQARRVVSYYDHFCVNGVTPQAIHDAWDAAVELKRRVLKAIHGKKTKPQRRERT